MYSKRLYLYGELLHKNLQYILYERLAWRFHCFVLSVHDNVITIFLYVQDSIFSLTVATISTPCSNVFRTRFYFYLNCTFVLYKLQYRIILDTLLFFSVLTYRRWIEREAGHCSKVRIGHGCGREVENWLRRWWQLITSSHRISCRQWTCCSDGIRRQTI